MRTKTIMALSTVTIPAQYLDSRRVALCSKPSVKPTSAITASCGLFSLRRAISAYMVNSQKLNSFFATTSTNSAVMRNDVSLCSSCPLLFKLVHIFLIIVSPIFFVLTIFKNCFWRKMLSPFADIIYTRLTLFMIFRWWLLPTSGTQSSTQKLFSPLCPSLFEVSCILLCHRLMIQGFNPFVKYFKEGGYASFICQLKQAVSTG